VHDQEVRDAILVERVMHVATMLRGILGGDATVDVPWSVSYLRDRLTEHRHRVQDLGRAHGRAGRCAGRWPVNGDRIIRCVTTLAVVVVAGIAAAISFGHIEHLALTHGQPLMAARALPVSVDGAVVASSLALLDAARRGAQTPVLARIMLGAGVAATLSANAISGEGRPGVYPLRTRTVFPKPSRRLPVRQLRVCPRHCLTAVPGRLGYTYPQKFSRPS
jgi:Protein of unknown function (DUF2637)